MRFLQVEGGQGIPRRGHHTRRGRGRGEACGSKEDEGRGRRQLRPGGVHPGRGQADKQRRGHVGLRCWLQWSGEDEGSRGCFLDGPLKACVTIERKGVDPVAVLEFLSPCCLASSWNDPPAGGSK
eukprot:750309-Hanusia_phi.AAC.1